MSEAIHSTAQTYFDYAYAQTQVCRMGRKGELKNI